MSDLIKTLLIPLVALVGLIVLIALNKITASVGVPLIAAIVSVHTGAAIGGNTTVVQSAPSAPTPPAPKSSGTAEQGGSSGLPLG